MHSLYAVENPLMDVIAHVDYEFLRRFNKSPGTMHLVPFEEVSALLAEVSTFRTLPGGSAANTARGVAWLASPSGLRATRELLGESASRGLEAPVYGGAIGRDARGDEFSALMTAAGVHSALVRKDTPTGTSVILVTPDGERTMNTYLGACRDFLPSDLALGSLADSRVLYLTGYMWDTENQRAAAQEAARFAHSCHPRVAVAFDLADPFAVNRYGELFREWIPGNVDLLFGNRDEIALLTGSACDEDCVRDALRMAPLVVMKTGARGCVVGHEGKWEAVAGVRVPVVDTTGAGDAFAAGFLSGWLRGLDPLASARLANVVAARIVSVEGCVYEDLSS